MHIPVDPSQRARVVCVSDSAYKVEPEECRALVGHLILWMGRTLQIQLPHLGLVRFLILSAENRSVYADRHSRQKIEASTIV